jgi:amino acid transporter
VGGSVLQTVVALLVLAPFALSKADPVVTLFTWLSTLGAMGLLTLLLMSSVAAIMYFARAGGARRNPMVTTLAPLLGVVLGAVALGSMVINVDSLLGASPGSLAPYLLPVILLAALFIGGLWAGHLRRTRPQVYKGISRGRPNVHEVPDDVRVTF